MLKMLLPMIFVFLWALPTVAGQVSGIDALFDNENREQIQLLLEDRNSSPTSLVSVSRLLSHDQIAKLYEQREYQPVWFDGWRLSPEARTLLEYLRNAGALGLCGNEYLLTELEGLLRIQADFSRHSLPLAPANRALLDLFLSQAFLTYATHMVEGQVDPALAHVDWRARRRKADLLKLLDYATRNHRIGQVLEGLSPPHEGYRLLVETLLRYQELSALGGWPEIPSGPSIRPGGRDERLPLIRALLSKTGDLADSVVTTTDYDHETEEALRLFQFRHGLVDDGVVGPKTLAALNVSVEERIRQIELNLERWRWMPKSFGKRHIRVNVADFSLKVVEDDEIVMQMPVIVGTRYRKTPVFSARMTYLEFAPYWTVPPTILREDKLPKIKSNPAYLEEKHFRILSRQEKGVFVDTEGIDWDTVEAETFPGLLRMEPGPWNPLGSVKFMFPNRFNVYLHDTNETYLFSNNVRSFSSGCIRVERPRELAFYLLENELGAERLQELFEAVTPEQVPIKPLPVHVQYWTAWVSPEGLIHFRRDVYFRDLDLDVALTEPAYRVIDHLEVNIGMRLVKNRF
ncbi:MAG: peptidoglycan-binding protein [Deltaproteobacteria bacterium]|nr:MAG: peptidoglycan-binding protein [Deltaproteobacteria bacterium]